MKHCPNADQTIPLQASSETSVVATKKLTKGKARRKEKKNLTCETCHKSFSCTGNLNKHRVRHSSVKPWVCGTCGAGFNQRRDLDAHNMQRHTGERPHKCKVSITLMLYADIMQTHRSGLHDIWVTLYKIGARTPGHHSCSFSALAVRKRFRVQIVLVRAHGLSHRRPQAPVSPMRKASLLVLGAGQTRREAQDKKGLLM